LIIAGPLGDRSDFYNTIDTAVQADKRPITRSTEQRPVPLTEACLEKIVTLLRNAELLTGESSLQTSRTSSSSTTQNKRCAPPLYQRAKDYIVRYGARASSSIIHRPLNAGPAHSEGCISAGKPRSHPVT